MQHFNLNVGGQGSREPLQIDFRGVLSHGLYKELMTLLIGKADEFIFNGGAVARAYTVNFTGIHGAARDILANDAVCFGIGINNVTAGLVEILEKVLTVERGVGKNEIITGLFFERRKIDGLALNTCGCTGFKAQKLDADLLK